ncbi:MAG TPA: peptidase [Trichocoleus sp.]
MIRSFRKYHRTLSIIMMLPLGLTILSGLGYTIFSDWLKMGSVGGFLLRLHTGDLVGLGQIYPILNGLGALGLLITGISLTGVMRRKGRSPSPSKE